MKQLLLAFLIIVCFSSCKDEDKPVEQKKQVTYVTCLGDGTEVVAEDEIKVLIINILSWSDSKNTFIVAPPNVIENDTVFKSFDNAQLSKNLIILGKTGFFTKGFIDNYKNIINTLDRKLKNGDYGKWYGGELPPFRFDNDVNPWCNCQDSFPWEEVKTEVISLDDNEGELYWKFGSDAGDDPSWSEFRYKFKVAKESGKWKIDWMEAFDFETSIKKDGV